MTTEDERRERVSAAIAETAIIMREDDGHYLTNSKECAEAAIEALGIPLPILAWITANPEAAKGLASGEMVAVPRQMSAAMFDAAEEAKDDWYSATIIYRKHTHLVSDIWEATLAAASPAPSGKAQGET